MSETQYVLSLDKLDLSLLSHYIDRPTNEKKLLWSKPCMDGESVYCKVQLPSDDVQDENSYIESLESSMCHICNIDVPQQYFKQHITSGLHQTYKRLTEKILENVSKQINKIIESTTDKQQSNLFFCETCSKVVLLEHKQKHYRSNYHLKCIDNYKLVDNFVEIYLENEQLVNENKSCKTNIKRNERNKRNLEYDSDSDTDWNFDSEDEYYNQILSAHEVDSSTVPGTSAKNHINNMSTFTTAETLEVTTMKNVITPINNVNTCKTLETPVIIPINKINTCTTTKSPALNPINKDHRCKPAETPAIAPIDNENKICKTPAIIPKTCKTTKTSALTPVNIVSTHTTVEAPANISIDKVNSNTSETQTLIPNNKINACKPPETPTMLERKSIKSNKALSMPPDISNEIVYFQYYLLDMMKKYKMEFDMPAVEQNYIIIVTPNGYKEKRTVDVFHSYKKIDDYIFCQLCTIRVDTDTSYHSRTSLHVKNIMQPISNCFTRQMIGYKTWNHCLVCNDIVTNYSSHFDFRHKTYYEEKKKACAGACNIPQNTDVNVQATISPENNCANRESSSSQLNKSTLTENKTTNPNLPSTSKAKPEAAQKIEELTSEEKLNEYNKQVAEFDDISVECLVCKLKIPNSDRNITEHIEGTRHKKAVQELLRENKIKQKSFNQYECKICTKSFDDFVDHVQENLGHRFLKGLLFLISKYE